MVGIGYGKYEDVLRDAGYKVNLDVLKRLAPPDRLRLLALNPGLQVLRRRGRNPEDWRRAMIEAFVPQITMAADVERRKHGERSFPVFQVVDLSDKRHVEALRAWHANYDRLDFDAIDYVQRLMAGGSAADSRIVGLVLSMNLGDEDEVLARPDAYETWCNKLGASVGYHGYVKPGAIFVVANDTATTESSLWIERPEAQPQGDRPSPETTPEH